MSEAKSAAEKLMTKTGDEFWTEFYSYKPPNIHEKEVIPLDGPSAPGGGSRSGRSKKSPKGNKVFVNQWEGI